MAKCKVLMKIKPGTKTSSYMVEQDGKYFKLNVPNMIEGNEIELKELRLEDLNPAWIDRYNKWNRKRERLLEHLATYKKDTLKIEESGLWRRNEYAHILPIGQEKRNLIDGAFCNALNKMADSIPLHPSFGHLNSSQAMCLNFMVPLKERGMLLEYIKKSYPDAVRGTELKELEEPAFERIVDENERTQFDFYCTTDAEETLSFEFKYSEPNFSFMKDDERHQEKFEQTYKDGLDKLGIDKETFASDYQLWRNILYAETHQHTVFFVFPKFRSDLQEAVDEAKQKCPEEVRQRIHCICIDDWVESLLQSDDSALAKHYSEFKKKYLPDIL